MEQISQIIDRFTQQHQKILAEKLNQLSIIDLVQITSFNNEFQKKALLKCTQLMQQNDYGTICILLEIFLKNLNINGLKVSTIISLIDNILQSVGVIDLKKILKVFSNHVWADDRLTQSEQNKLLKIINLLLKRISKTEDYQLRGQLHLQLSKILPLCHDSGFHKPLSIPKTTQLQPQNQQYSKIGVDELIGFEFYEQFWQLQKYFMDINEIGNIIIDNNNSIQKNNNKIFILQLKRIQSIMTQTIEYFNRNLIESISEKFKNVEQQTIKFLKIFNLLPLQLNDSYFRVTFLVQCLIFCFTLKNPSSKGGLILTNQQKNIIEEMQKSSINQLRIQATTQQANDLVETFEMILKNQLKWVDLKDTWKQSKKQFVRPPSNEIIQIKRQLNEQIPNHITRSLSQVEIKRKNTSSHIQQKLKIGGSKLQTFLQISEPKLITQQPTHPSFSYFFGQAVQVLDNFQQSGNLGEFSRGEYNLFQWKAMRCLYRENVKDMNLGLEKNNKEFKQYRLLNFMNKKQDELFDQPRKKIKPNQ